jgi:hydrocephalus-inducing protein
MLKLSGLDTLQDIVIAPTSGLLEPYRSVTIQASFEASQAIIHKKNIKLEVTDVANLLGVVQSLPIAITAEAYNVAVELQFPKGSGTILNLGTLRVFEEKQTTLSLRNKGKYAMNYTFVINRPKLFVVTPNSGTVAASDKASANTSVAIAFKVTFLWIIGITIFSEC